MSQCWQVPGAGLGARRRTDYFSQHLVWALEVPPGPKLIHESSQLNLHASKCQVPIIAGWAGVYW